MNVEQHLDIGKVANRELKKALRISKLQGQWTSTKSLQHQAIGLGGTPDYMLRQFDVALERIEKELKELKAVK